MKKLTSIVLIVLCSFILHAQKQPNVLLIITDDQGYGDLGFHGNPNVHTPHLDALAEESVRFTDFYVSPVCAPTRSSLMTGRYSLRTGVKDTYNGGAIMANSEITLAELLQAEGYKTGIFGKWHLGDNYPSRPNDQGFEESVIHHSGGMGQVGDLNTYYRGDSSYFDPTLWHNGKKEKYKGYCTDVFTNEALEFIQSNQNQPFFAYVAFNAPHTPLQVPQKYLDKYKDIDPRKGIESISPHMSDKNIEDARRVYAMVSNIDDNVKRMLSKLEDLGIRENTIVIFMTDNGPQQTRYVGGMRGQKGSVYRGGVRVPFFIRYPEKFEGGKDINQTSAHIDVLPTLAELCGFPLPKDRKIDGQSMLPWLENSSQHSIDRSLFFYWTRKFPERYRNVSLQHGDYRLVANTTFDASLREFELYNYKLDPGEKTNLINTQESKAVELKEKLVETFDELVESKNLINTPHVVIGSEAEPTSYLNRNDAAGERGIWSQHEKQGYWNCEILKGDYNIEIEFVDEINETGTLMLELGTEILRLEPNLIAKNRVEIENIHLPHFKGRFMAYQMDKNQEAFPFYVKFQRL